jgi:hypothetical protein
MNADADITMAQLTMTATRPRQPMSATGASLGEGRRHLLDERPEQHQRELPDDEQADRDRRRWLLMRTDRGRTASRTTPMT